MPGSCWPVHPAAFAPRKRLALGASQVRVLEPEPELLRHPARRARSGPAGRRDAQCPYQEAPGPLADANRGVYDVVDLSADFLDAAETNATAFTREAIVSYLRILAPNGMVSIPVSIRDFPVYALRMLATVRAALLAAGIADPAAHVIVYRSAWSVRILVSRDGWSAAQIERRAQILRRPLVRPVLVSGLDVAQARAGSLQRPARSLLRQGRGRGQRPGRRHRR